MSNTKQDKTTNCAFMRTVNMMAYAIRQMAVKNGNNGDVIVVRGIEGSGIAFVSYKETGRSQFVNDDNVVIIDTDDAPSLHIILMEGCAKDTLECLGWAFEKHLNEYTSSLKSALARHRQHMQAQAPASDE